MKVHEGRSHAWHRSSRTNGDIQRSELRREGRVGDSEAWWKGCVEEAVESALDYPKRGNSMASPSGSNGRGQQRCQTVVIETRKSTIAARHRKLKMASNTRSTERRYR